MTLPTRKSQLAKLEEQINAADFWSNPENSQKIMQERKRLEEQIAQDARISGLTSDLDTLFELAQEGESVNGEIEREIRGLSTHLEALETQMLLSGENDVRSAIVTIHPGAGGTESQDWAEMLLRMYLRWAERQRMETIVTDRLEGKARASNPSPSKSTAKTLTGCCKAKWACTGWCGFRRSTRTRGGIRRLLRCLCIRRSTTKSRSTSSPTIMRVDTFRASGAGGQHVNRTDSAIRMTHLPTNIVVQCQNERSQHKNRASAMKQLRAKLYEHEMEKKRVEERKLEDTKLGINFGSQIRSYVLAPYRMIKDHRTKLAVGDVDRVLDGDLDALIHAFLVFKKTGKTASDSDKDEPLD